MRALIARLKAHERQLSALAMVGGFIFDNFAFGRIDHPATQIVFTGYLLFAAISIAVHHSCEARAEIRGEVFRWRAVASALTQFALGALWSAFLIFYSRSSAVIVSWPFLAVLAAILLGNEFLRTYHARLMFTVVLFFIALFSYMTIALPIAIGAMDEFTFLLSGAATLIVFAAYLCLLALLGRQRMWNDIGKISLGALAAFCAINLFYFFNLLPPIPLAMADSGLYHQVARNDGGYRAIGEPASWLVKFGQTQDIHLKQGDPLYAYSAVFAPIALKTNIVHRWQYHDAKKGWITASTIGFPIRGGRDNGYRGFTKKSNLHPGAWRVDVETLDGRIIGRMRFNIIWSPVEPDLQTLDLK